MYKSRKKIIFYLSFIGAILIIFGLILTYKELQDEEYLLNMPDDDNHYKVVFNFNGANKLEHRVIRCEIVNGECKITLPKAERNNGVVLGYSDNKDDLEPKYKINETINVNGNMNLYVISYKTNTLYIDGSNVDFLDKSSVDCRIYNTNKSCEVELPRYNKVGYENKGYSTFADSSSGFIYAGDKYELASDTTLYPIYSTQSRKQSIDVSRVLTYNDSFIEIENGCPDNIVDKYLGYLDEIKKYAPFLLLGNKISFVVDDTFDKIWGATYVGMNYGPKNLRSVDIRCSSTSYNDFYATMVHEMAHSWDFYYARKMGSTISGQSDVINLFEKYTNHADRPFREYSYSNIYEYVADMMKYYYFKYYTKSSIFRSSTYPKDVKKAIEKYICISKNNYEEDKCK